MNLNARDRTANNILDPRTVDRLGSLAGLLGSDFAGERANAAEQATRLLQKLGLTWREVIDRAFQVVAVECDPSDFRAFIRDCLACPKLTDWERQFLESIRQESWDLSDLSEKQVAVMDRIVAKVRRSRS